MADTGAEPPAPEPKPALEPDATALSTARDELVSATRRMERETERAREQARADVISGLFPVLDSLDRSLAAAGRTPEQPLRDGIFLVRDQFEEALTRCGLERIVSVGQPFDPRQHEALAVVAVDDAELDGKVVDEVERGYRHAGRIIRAPKVRVGRRR